MQTRFQHVRRDLQVRVMLPAEINPNHREMIAKLSKLKAPNFDHEHVTAMVVDHEKDVTAFESVAKTGTAEVKAFCREDAADAQSVSANDPDIANKMGHKAKPLNPRDCESHTHDAVQKLRRCSVRRVLGFQQRAYGSAW